MASRAAARRRFSAVTGTAYKPLDNAHQIRDNLQLMCELINAKQNGFEKALLAITLISYIQPFEDGNKRTGRIMAEMPSLSLLCAKMGEGCG